MNKQVIEELRKNNLLVEELDRAEKKLKIYHRLRFPMFLVILILFLDYNTILKLNNFYVTLLYLIFF